MTHDRVFKRSFPLTQEFLAQMLGVRRPTVSLAAGMLQKAGLIHYVRGEITIVDRAGLEAASCECYAIIRSEFERLVGTAGYAKELRACAPCSASPGDSEGSVMANRDIIVVGGSAGSGPVLRTLASGLAQDFPGSMLISTHVPSQSMGHLKSLLSSAGPLPVSQAIDGQPIERGHIYVAAPDRHLLVIDGTIRLGEGPRENMARPAIDPLFRSAALSYGPRTVGVVLSGLLNDGAAGLHAIKSVGGTAVVQHPLDAAADQMPLAALEATQVDHVTAAAELATVLTELAGSRAGPALAPSETLSLEVQIAAGGRLGSRSLRQLADPSTLTCPDCHGVLSEVRDGQPLRFRCQIGHAYTADVLEAHVDEVDQAVRVAMRVMEERVTLVERMAQDARDTGRTAVAELYDARAAEYRGYAKTLRDAAILSLRMSTRQKRTDRTF